MDLQEFFTQIPKAAIAFSGGADSGISYVGGEAVRMRCARLLCEDRISAGSLSWRMQDDLRENWRYPWKVVGMDILSVPEAADNGPDRCYYCKRALFTCLRNAARADGYTVLLDGTNASDEAGDRPGMRALRELDVRSPLRECGLTKSEVRKRSEQAGLFTWKKPAYACLATRIPTGTRIRTGDLEKGGNRPSL